MKTRRFVRHGDLVIVECEIPAGARKVKRDGPLVLAYGEVTGHAHTIEEEWAELLETEGRRFIEVEKPVTVTHQEHATRTIAPGTWEILRQSEWTDSMEPRRVSD